MMTSSVKSLGGSWQRVLSSGQCSSSGSAGTAGCRAAAAFPAAGASRCSSAALRWREPGRRKREGGNVRCEVVGKDGVISKVDLSGKTVVRLKIVAGESDFLAGEDEQVQCLGSGECEVDSGEPVAVAISVGNGADAQVMAAAGSRRMFQPKLVWFAKSQEDENRFIDRAVNACLASSAVAFAVSKFLTVDHDYWQGWTVYEILRYAPVHNWEAYEEALKNNPVLAKMMISGTVYTIGDWIAQCNEGRPLLEFDRMRILRSGLVGFTFHGSLSHFYYHFCEALFPFQDWWVVPLKVAFDQTIWSAFWNSLYFTLLGVLRLENPVTIYKDLKVTFFPMLTAGWKLWPFAHLLTYGVVPLEQRLLWVDCVEIVWVTILSMISNEKAESRIAIAENEVTTELKSPSDSTDM